MLPLGRKHVERMSIPALRVWALVLRKLKFDLALYRVTVELRRRRFNQGNPGWRKAQRAVRKGLAAWCCRVEGVQ